MAQLAYDPNGQFENLAVGETAIDTFTYTVTDGNGGTDVATVNVTITGVAMMRRRRSMIMQHLVKTMVPQFSTWLVTILILIPMTF